MRYIVLSSIWRAYISIKLKIIVNQTLNKMKQEAILDEVKPILVSACLAGFPCRYDGKSSPNAEAIQLVQEGKAIAICPEQLGGLQTPRPPVELVDDKALSASGADFTAAFHKGAEISLELAKKYHCKKSILKFGSPSCGFGKIYDGSFSGQMKVGNGVAAELFSKNGIEIRSV